MVMHTYDRNYWEVVVGKSLAKASPGRRSRPDMKSKLKKQKGHGSSGGVLEALSLTSNTTKTHTHTHTHTIYIH
jgi:hypothetical protein